MSTTTDKTFATLDESFNDWLAAGSLQLSQLVAARGASARHRDALTDALLDRATSLRTLVAHHIVELNANRVPLLGLPFELISEILSFIAADLPVQRWMKVGQVCSTLRAALLERHDLWGEAVCSWPSCRDELLKRSGSSAPLTLRVNNADDAEFAKKQLHRARKILSNHHRFSKDFTRLAEPRVLPFLENLELYSWPDEVVAIETHTTMAMPRLKRLLLQGVYWNFPSFALTDLCIKSNKYDDVRFGYSPSQFCAILRQCGQLRTLQLERCIPDFLGGLPHGTMIQLLSLCRLELSDLREYVLGLWNVLAVSHDTEVILHLECEDPSFDDVRIPPFSDDAACLKRHLIGRQASSLVVGSVPQGILLHIESKLPSNTDVGNASAREDPAMTLTVEYKSCFRFVPHRDVVVVHKDALFRLCNGLDLHHIVHLDWNAYSTGDRYYWVNVLQKFPALGLLEVESMDQSCLSALLPQNDPDNTVGPVLLLPLMRELIIKDTRIRGESVYDNVYHDNHGLSEQELVASLEARAAHGRPIHSLRLPSSKAYSAADLRPHHIDILKKLHGVLTTKFPETAVLLSFYFFADNTWPEFVELK